MGVIKHPGVLRDLEELADRFAERSIRHAEKLITAADETFRLLADFPGLGEEVSGAPDELAGLRVYTLKKFPTFIVLFRQVPSGIEVFRVVRGRRNLPSILEPDS
jgi:plasmid stabilization system protein ParE